MKYTYFQYVAENGGVGTTYIEWLHLKYGEYVSALKDQLAFRDDQLQRCKARYKELARKIKDEGPYGSY